MTDTYTTRSGASRVYHRDNAGDPDAHRDEGGPWYYQPNDWAGWDVYSAGYPTPEAALEAAEEEELQQTWEAEEQADWRERASHAPDDAAIESSEGEPRA